MCPEVDDPDATMLGPAQETWLLDGLADSVAVWDVLCNDVILSGFDFDPDSDAAKALYLLDTWDGYPAARDRLVNALAENLSPNRNFVVITGDVHAAFAMETHTADGTVVASRARGRRHHLGLPHRGAHPERARRQPPRALLRRAQGLCAVPGHP